jgi:hypothetical protein
MDELDKEEMKAVWKEAFKEWIDEKVKEWGYFSIKLIAMGILGYVLYLLGSNGFIKI